MSCNVRKSEIDFMRVIEFEHAARHDKDSDEFV